MYRDLKYLIALSLPAFTYFSFVNTGLLSFSVVIYAFLFLPLIETILPQSQQNLDKEVVDNQKSKFIFDVLLYLNVPIIYGFILLFFYQMRTSMPDTITIIGWVSSLGLLLGSVGINVAHELGHKLEWYKKVMAKALLLPCFYMHFYIEHNQGHHKNVATDLDPASAKKGENLYFFWMRSLVGSYLSAWRIEIRNCKRKDVSTFGLNNELVVFTLVQFAFLITLVLIVGLYMTLLFLVSSLFAVLLLETINYIEHYGLRREKLPNGRYERVRPCHSWNSNHELGRIVLYELTRHSDHHYQAQKKYQLLDHHDEAKQLPFGYPASMVLSLFPPLWYKLMNSRL